MRKERRKRASVESIGASDFPIFNDADVESSFTRSDGDRSAFSDLSSGFNQAFTPAAQFKPPSSHVTPQIPPVPDFDDNSTCWELESTASMPLGHHELRGRSSAMSEYSAELGYVQANSSVERTLKLMEQDSADARRIAVDSMVRIGHVAAPFAGRIVMLLAHPNEQVQESAIDCLVRLAAQGVAVAEAVLELLDSSSSRARKATARVLVALGAHASSVASNLVALLESTQDKAVRTVVVSVLGGLGEHVAFQVPAIAALTSSPQSDVRRAALKTLGRLHELAVPHQGQIAKLVEDADYKTRWAAVLILSKLPQQQLDGACVAAIATRLNDSSAPVQVAAVASLAVLDRVPQYWEDILKLLQCHATPKVLLAVFDVLAAPLECMDVVKLEQTVAAVEPLVNHSDVGVHTAATSLADYLSQQLSGRMEASQRAAQVDEVKSAESCEMDPHSPSAEAVQPASPVAVHRSATTDETAIEVEPDVEECVKEEARVSQADISESSMSVVEPEQQQPQSEQVLELEAKLKQAQDQLELVNEQAMAQVKKDDGGGDAGWGSTATVAGVTAAVVLLAVWLGNTLRRKMRH